MRAVIPAPRNGRCVCARCGSVGGLLWETRYAVLDLEIPGVPPYEPNLSEPVLCDDCEWQRRQRRDRASVP